MNRQTEDIDTCTYIKRKLFQLNVQFQQFRAQTVFFVVEKQLLRLSKEETMLMIFQLHSCNISNASKTSFHLRV